MWPPLQRGGRRIAFYTICRYQHPGREEGTGRVTSFDRDGKESYGIVAGGRLDDIALVGRFDSIGDALSFVTASVHGLDHVAAVATVSRWRLIDRSGIGSSVALNVDAEHLLALAESTLVDRPDLMVAARKLVRAIEGAPCDPQGDHEGLVHALSTPDPAPCERCAQSSLSDAAYALRRAGIAEAGRRPPLDQLLEPESEAKK